MATTPPSLRSRSDQQVRVLFRFSAGSDGPRDEQAALLHPRRGGRARHRGRPVGVLPGPSVRPEPAGDPVPR